MTTTSIPLTSPDYDHTRIIERPDGFYWQDKITEETCGPFPTMMAAIQDMQNHGDTGYGVVESLSEAEAEIGISDWIDPDTGEPAEESQTHLRDE